MFQLFCPIQKVSDVHFHFWGIYPFKSSGRVVSHLMLGLWNNFLYDNQKCFFPHVIFLPSCPKVSSKAEYSLFLLCFSPDIFSELISSFFISCASVAFCDIFSLSLCPFPSPFHSLISVRLKTLMHSRLGWETEATIPSWLWFKLNHCPPFMSGHIVFFFDVGLLLWQCFAPYLEKHPDGGKGERGKLVSACHLSSIGQDILLM